MWLLHLHGAYALLQQSQEFYDTDPQLSALIEMYNYICCMASLTCEKVPPKFALRPPADFGDEHLNIHPLLGHSAESYWHLGNFNELCNRLQSEDTVSTIRQVKKGAQSIELALQAGKPLHSPSLPRPMVEARAAALTTRWAVIMRLQKFSQSTTNNETQPKHATDSILSAMSLIRPGSETEARLLFPLFMAGTGSDTKVNRLTVEYRINVMETTVGFRNIVVAHRLLDEIWRRSNEGTVVDWEHLMRTKYPSLVLL